MTDEAHAGVKEVGTLNEELQATNEALATLSREFQATVARLNATNQELLSRSREMQELALASENERARLAMTLRSMSDAVLVIDRAGHVEFANETARRTFGSEHPLRAILDEEGRQFAFDETPQYRSAHGECFKMEFTLQNDDSTRHFEATGDPMGSGGEIDGGVIVVRDITDRSLGRLQDEFLALASHELRNPLTVLQSSLQLLVRRLDSHPDDLETLRYRAETAFRQTRQLGHLVSDLVNATQLRSGKYRLELEPIRLDRLVAETVDAVQPIAHEQQIEFGAHEPVTITADVRRLEQVVFNIVQNAITYAPNTERIDVRVIRIGDTAAIEVEDYGRGIPSAEIPNLFTRFYQVKRDDRPSRSGLGLGLYISQQIVEAHHGRIEVESEEGKGTTFRILLPLAKAAEEPE